MQDMYASHTWLAPGPARPRPKPRPRHRRRRVRAAAPGRARPRPWAAPPAPGCNGLRPSDPPEIRHGEPRGQENQE